MGEREKQVAALTSGIDAVKFLRTSTEEQAVSGLQALRDAGWAVVPIEGVVIPDRIVSIRDHYKGIAERIGAQGGGDRTLNDINYLLGYIEHLVGYVGEFVPGRNRVSQIESTQSDKGSE